MIRSMNHSAKKPESLNIYGSALFTVSPLTFSGSVSGGAGGNTYLWQFGDGVTSTDRIAAHTYNTAGTYQVVFKGTDRFNKEATASQTITITDNPNVPGKPSYLIPDFANCSGPSANYTLFWGPSGAQPSNYYSYEFKPSSASSWYPIQWLTSTFKYQSGLSGISSVRVRGCLANSEPTCGPYIQRTFTAVTCGGPGGPPDLL